KIPLWDLRIIDTSVRQRHSKEEGEGALAGVWDAVRRVLREGRGGWVRCRERRGDRLLWPKRCKPCPVEVFPLSSVESMSSMTTPPSCYLGTEKCGSAASRGEVQLEGAAVTRGAEAGQTRPQRIHEESPRFPRAETETLSSRDSEGDGGSTIPWNLKVVEREGVAKTGVEWRKVEGTDLLRASLSEAEGREKVGFRLPTKAQSSLGCKRKRTCQENLARRGARRPSGGPLLSQQGCSFPRGSVLGQSGSSGCKSTGPGSLGEGTTCGGRGQRGRWAWDAEGVGASEWKG
ncbi:unnamed protein product, partial [Discosporangium mesarthrocarpum]